ncbi:hypothetical protein F383_26511 [Gossypium arboreum]|uniref:Uncharacterized protein n=1 Tax=Gossypium arboreum TaxID=29729 RepID=A0A0B0MUM1_GOSAR|nr:hypothetical protein F383_26511 [Gossypium arboreum]
MPMCQLVCHTWPIDTPVCQNCRVYRINSKGVTRSCE